MEFNETNLKLAIKTNGPFAAKTIRKWKERNKIPDYLFLKKPTKPALKKLQYIVNLPELRSGYIAVEGEITSSLITNFKQHGRISNKVFYKIDFVLKCLQIQLKKFASEPIVASDKYYDLILDLTDIRLVNWVEIFKKIEIEGPNSKILRRSYFQNSSPNPSIIEKYKSYFEALKQEIALLIFKIR